MVSSLVSVSIYNSRNLKSRIDLSVKNLAKSIYNSRNLKSRIDDKKYMTDKAKSTIVEI